MTLGNMLIVIFLALKNTPMKLLTGYSYERLNCLHQIAGCSMFIMMVLHAALYTAYFNGQGRLVSIYAEPDRIAGIVAGFAFLSVVFAAIVIRRWWYELFYVMHISSWIMGIIAVGFHQPDFGHKILIITILAAAMWVLDRVIRAARVLYYSSNNEVTVHPLPDGGTKVVLKKAPAVTRPGKHCFLYIPAIRKFEAHPFTVHHSQPVEFTIKARDGFTRDLHKYAVAHPGAKLKASVDGPYGAFPDPMEFDKIVLIAGGGGATFTFGLAMNILERLDESRPKNVVFIWAVRKHGMSFPFPSLFPSRRWLILEENLSWFREQLQILKTHAHSSAVDVNLYITNATTNDSSSNNDTSSESGADSPPVSPTTESDPEKTQLPTATTTSSTASDVEKAIVETQSGYDTTTTAASKKPTAEEVAAGHAVQTGRPDVASLIRDAVNSTPKDKRVLVAACGPVPLMNVVRDTSAKLISVRGAGVEVHLEQFGWWASS
jgi:ferredoxin-NADP reductase